MNKITQDIETEIVLALDDRVSYLEEAITLIDGRLKVVDTVLTGQVHASIPVSRSTMVVERSKCIEHFQRILQCYKALGASPSVQALLLASTLNLNVE